MRGNCRKGMSTFAIRGDVEVLKADRQKLEKLIGQKAVLAFSPFPRGLLLGEADSSFQPRKKWTNDSCFARAIWIHKLNIPFSGSTVSARNLDALKNHMGPAPYPYSTCMLVQIVKVEKSSDSAVLNVTGTVQKVLLGDNDDRALQGQYASFVVPRHLLPKASNTQLVGRRCVWEFSGHGSGEIYLSEGHCPFRDQIFTADDVSRLQARLDIEQVIVDERKAAVLRLLRQRWPEQRLRDFCIDTTRRVAINCRLHPFSESNLWSGNLYSDLKLANGKTRVEYVVEVIDGVPEVCELYVNSGLVHDSLWEWQPEFQWLDDLYAKDWNADDYRTFKITTKLENMAAAYLTKLKLHWTSSFGNQWASRLMSQTALSRCANGYIYTVPLAGGKRLRAFCDSKENITSITIDGTADRVWSEVLAKAVENLNTVNSIEFIKAGTTR